MNFFKALFGSKEETPEEKTKGEVARNFDTLKYDGVRALRAGEVRFATDCFQHALELQDDLEVRDYLSQALIGVGDLLLAYEQLQKLAEAQPDNVQIWIRMANVAYMMEDYGAMANACEKALLLDGDNPQVHYLYARACLGQGDTVNAIAMLTKSIVLKADYYDAYLLRGETLLQVDEVAEADEDVHYLLEHITGNEDVLLLEARVERRRGEIETAIETYGKVLDINPFCIAAFKERGALLIQNGDEEHGNADLQQAEALMQETAG
ncbi:tetratricopeptide repeat protein [Hoylesella pleuritidis]|uniref:tetratricopeptide repeat protein n=1 Tax=Hoylesella pleuritidis TaxID=407975 RepID=UPI0028E4D08D|nr:tetratricopeptide repeat protein [Hoylesella pleuritidis]